MEAILPVKNSLPSSSPLPQLRPTSGPEKRSISRSAPIARAVQASCSLPVIFTPTEINRRILVDGGVTSQIPVRTVREELGANMVIAVNVNYNSLELDRFDSMIKIAAHLSALWASRNARVEEKLADVLVNVNARGIPLFDLSRAKELLKRGTKAAEDMLPEIKALM